MIVNPKKFQSITISKRKNIQPRNVGIQIKDQTVKSQEQVKLLCINIDDNLKFDSHIGEICKRVSDKCNP